MTFDEAIEIIKNTIKNIDSDSEIEILPVTKKVNRRGDNNANAKLTSDQVYEIRNLFNRDFSLEKIGRMYNVSASCISHILRGDSWGWLK